MILIHYNVNHAQKDKSIILIPNNVINVPKKIHFLTANIVRVVHLILSIVQRANNANHAEIIVYLIM